MHLLALPVLSALDWAVVVLVVLIDFVDFGTSEICFVDCCCDNDADDCSIYGSVLLIVTESLARLVPWAAEDES